MDVFRTAPILTQPDHHRKLSRFVVIGLINISIINSPYAPRSKAVCDRHVWQGTSAGSQTLRERKLRERKLRERKLRKVSY